jgi:adenylate kinase
MVLRVEPIFKALLSIYNSIDEINLARESSKIRIVALDPSGVTWNQQKAKEYSNAGKLVPDEVTIAMVEERISREDAQGGFLLDGFPRNVSQSVALEKILAKTGRSIGMILNLDVPLEEVKNRLAKRAAIEGRSDDADPKVIQKRIETYVSESAPCLDYYKPSGKVKTIDGTATIEQVWSSLKACF